MGCCESREMQGTATPLPSPPDRLAESQRELSHLQEGLQKLSMHLRHFNQKASEYYSLVYELKAEKRDYLGKFRELGESIAMMKELLEKLDTEVQAQYISERESTDLSRDELLSIIRIVRAQKQASRLESLAAQLQHYLAYPDKRTDFHSQVLRKVDIVRKKGNSLLDYVQFIAQAKNAVAAVVARDQDLQSNAELENERWAEARKAWTRLSENTQKLAVYTESLAHRLVNSFQSLESDLRAIKDEVDAALDRERQNEKVRELLQAAQPYLALLPLEPPEIARRSYRNSVERLSYGQTTPITQSESSFLEEYMGVLRRLCLLNRYRDGEVCTVQEAYEKLIALLHAKAEDDAVRKSAYLPMELFLITHFAEGKGDKLAVVTEITKFVGALDKLSGTPLGHLALELLRFTESDPLSSHEEMFICKASKALQEMVDFSGSESTPEELWQTAGKMPLSLVIPIVEHWFTRDSDTAAKVIAALLPSLSAVELTVYYVMFRLAQRDKTAEDLFYTLDTRKANILAKEEFVQGIKSQLDIRLEDTLLMEVAELLDKTTSDGIFRTEFTSLFNSEKYESEAESDKYTVTRIGVLEALRTVYFEWKSEQAQELYVNFILIPSADSKVSIKTAESFIKTLDPEMTSGQLLAYTRKLKATCGDSFLFEAFKDFYFQYPIGERAQSFFCKDYLAIPGLAWADDKLPISEFVHSLLKGKKSLNDFATNDK